VLTIVVILLTAFPVHEFAHAWVADRFGDDTPRLNGRLTLNPLAHLDLIGTVMMLLVGFGWAKPVPINPIALKRHSAAAPMLVSLAGPMSNFGMAILAAIVFRLGLFLVQNQILHVSAIITNVLSLLTVFIRLNLLLMLFNLIPLFPLDGEKVLQYFLPPAGAQVLDNIRPYSSMILMVLLFVLPMVGLNLISSIIYPAIINLTHLLTGI
jgi:Zn-dependent protease